MEFEEISELITVIQSFLFAVFISVTFGKSINIYLFNRGIIVLNFILKTP